MLFRSRDVLDGTLHEPVLRARWPKELLDAVGTRGFAKEVRVAFAGARALGIAGDELTAIGDRAGDQTWAAIGPVLDEYLESLIQDDAIDYGELMYTAVAALQSDPSLVSGIRHIYVDEYQDTDHMQVALLERLCVHAQSLVAVGDPDQSIDRKSTRLNSSHT